VKLMVQYEEKELELMLTAQKRVTEGLR